ncbi:hypothetical protein QE422_003809 [Chryseobacterium sp. SORGH_AS 447]|nr:hypothetical protein [Chryseobacterium sp. SORGH_AS_0447]
MIILYRSISQTKVHKFNTRLSFPQRIAISYQRIA